MTLPVPILKNANILNTRRIWEGRCHLAPNPVVNQVIRYALAYNANKYKLGLYAHISLSNHQHTPFHDPDGLHADFRRDFHSQVTRSINAHRGTSEAKWSPDRKSPIIIFDTEALLEYIAYTVANACRHNLVETPEQWPGVVSLIEDLAGPTRMIKKPKCFYDPLGDLPNEVPLRFVKPPELESWTDEEYRQEVSRRVEAKCQIARDSRRAKGTKPLGRQQVLAQCPTDSARTQHPKGKLNPRIACSIKTLRIALLQWLTRFRQEHRSARIAFEGGEWEVEFPFGTYLHRRRYGVNCSAVGPPAWAD